MATEQIPLIPSLIADLMVTPSSPVSSTPQNLDFTRCAALHNHLYEVAWARSGRSPDDLPRQTWFERHGDSAENIRARLHPSLAQFLERAYAVPYTEISFFYYVSALNDPKSLWINNGPMYVPPGEDPYRWLTLYEANLQISEHIDGLNYDQKRHRAVMQLDIGDKDWTRADDSDPLWFPLESVLSKWLKMMQVGKITAEHEDSEADNERYPPWIYRPFGETQLEATVAGFQRLIAAILNKMPRESSLSSTDPLVSTEALDAASVQPTSFAYLFATSSKRPPPTLRYIAPGILVPPTDADSFEAIQSFSTLPADNFDESMVAPVLLFPLESDVRVSPNAENYQNPSFDYRYLEAVSEPGILTGLYTDSVDHTATVTMAEEGFRFVLPYNLGLAEFARKSTGEKFHDKTSLFQHGFYPFGGEVYRAQRLERLFDLWTKNVEEGVWSVGEQGVEGGIDKWKDADTSANWQAYWLDIDW